MFHHLLCLGAQRKGMVIKMKETSYSSGNVRMAENPSLPYISRHEKRKPKKAAQKAWTALTPAKAVFTKNLSHSAPELEHTIPERYRLALYRDSGFFSAWRRGWQLKIPTSANPLG